MKAEQRTIELSSEELEELDGRVQRGELEQGDVEIIQAMVETICRLTAALDEKNMSIKRLKKILFGSKSEKTRAVVKEAENEQSGSEQSQGEEEGERGEQEPKKEKDEKKKTERAWEERKRQIPRGRANTGGTW